MHRLKVLILGPSSFISTLKELKPFLKFNPIVGDVNSVHDIILFHSDAFEDNKHKDYISRSDSIKICASKKKSLVANYDAFLLLPATLKEINASVENIAAKKKFNENSSIKIKKYLLNKNEKKLYKEENFIILTEKEIQLLELFLKNKESVSKDYILSSVWNYSANVDTHTVETHIYRLRKKISERFLDDKFILNNKDGYYL